MRPRDAFRLDWIARVVKARSVHERHPQAVDVDDVGDEIAGRTGNFGDDRASAADKRVEQAGLAHVRGADNDDLKPFANQPASASAREERARLVEQLLDCLGDVARCEEVIALVWKIDRGLEARDEIEQRGIDVANRARQRAVELIERRSRLERSRRVDQVADRFGLHQIDPAIEKCAERELARLGQPCARFDCRRHDRVQHDRRAMRAQLDDIVARIGVRRGKECDDGLIDGTAKAVPYVHFPFDGRFRCVRRARL